MKRQQTISRLGVLLFGVFCLSLSVFGSEAQAFNFSVAIAPPPAYRIVGPPVTVVIPGTYVYVVPDIDVDIFFFHGFWYRGHEGHWFRAHSYNGPWSWVPPRRVPRAMLDLPRHDYRRIPPGHSRIPYGHLKRDWSRWERDRHWERDNAWREGWRKDDKSDDRNRDGRHNGRGWNEGRGDQRNDDRDRDGRDRRSGEFGPVPSDRDGRHNGR